jgi:hypothetical protein
MRGAMAGRKARAVSGGNGRVAVSKIGVRTVATTLREPNSL